MDALAKELISAHGGLDAWERLSSVRAHLIQGGGLWGIKGMTGVLDDTYVTVDLKRQFASHAPFGAGDRHSSFEPDRVALLDSDGQVLEALDAPRESFAGHDLMTPWNELQLAYFAGLSLWTYLNVPFLLSWPGVEATVMPPWEEQGETWRRLRVEFPDDITVHSKVQTLYVGADGLLKRLDYDVEIAGNTPGAHYVSDYVEVAGIKLPTKRRIFPRQPDGQSLPEPLVVSIDLDEIEFS